MTAVMEAPPNFENRDEVFTQLTTHWLIDETAASEISKTITQAGADYISEVLEPILTSPDGVSRRDASREEVKRIYSKESDKRLYIMGPCSLDFDTDYTELFDYLEEMQRQYPNAVVGVRLPAAKPRTVGGNTGLFYSTQPGGREKMLNVYKEAFDRGIPIFTEITDKDQYAAFAPYLTGAWLGARDMQSTDLRMLFSGTRMNVAVKNGTDGRLSSLENAIIAIGKNTDENDGSGVNFGYLTNTCQHKEGGPPTFSVGQGNHNVAIIARGYDLDEERLDGDKIEAVDRLSADERRTLALRHLSNVCILGAKLKIAALLDGSHQVPRMFSLDRKDSNRFLTVLHLFREAAEQGLIRHVDQISGFLGEVSVNEGITDKNLVLTPQNRAAIIAEISGFEDAWHGWSRHATK